MLEHIERLKAWQALDLPTGIERLVHQNRLLKIAREGGQMTPADLAKFEPQRRYATLVALATEGMATVTDEIIDLHDRILGKLFNAAKNKHQQQFQASGKAINAKVRLYGRIGQALIDAKQSGRDAFAAIEAVMSWDSFAESVTEAQKLAQPDDFDFLHRIGESYATLRRYAPEFLAVLKLRAAPAAKNVLDAIEVLRGMNTDNARKLPADAPTGFIKPRWQKLVMTDAGIDRRYYELCALSELKNSLRSGDIWVQGSRQFKDFEDYLVPPEKFTSLKQSSELPLAVATDCEQYLHERLTLLEAQLATVNRMAAANDLPDAIITESGLKITPLDAAVPDTAQALIDQTAMVLPHVKITELLLEVDEWTGFTRHFTHLKSGDLAKDKNLLLTTIPPTRSTGLTKMAESCPGTTYAKLAWLQARHTRDETYSTALAELVNARFGIPLPGTGAMAPHHHRTDRISEPLARQRARGTSTQNMAAAQTDFLHPHLRPIRATQVVNVGLRDSTYVLDGLLYHESDLRIEEHYTDTAGFTDHVFALMHLLGFRFAPRIRDLGDTKLYIPKGDAAYDALKPMIGGTLNIKHVRAHWDEILRLATSIKQGTVTASLMLRKLGSYPRQNGLAVALRELGRIERTLFILDWLQSVELRRRVHAGLNKGEARNALARAVFFNRLGEIRDRSFEQQRYRASGLNP
ncbi:Tn3 family transposase [Klebsiella pneumoniae]|uniref:Tn3 family transposase n=1 Tax=Klebsiella pneumoniae TaxID=573 RepID=UPI001E57BDA3|nr:Tn3 family transposase [Klebsiella pneumoniae]